ETGLNSGGSRPRLAFSLLFGFRFAYSAREEPRAPAAPVRGAALDQRQNGRRPSMHSRQLTPRPLRRGALACLLAAALALPGSAARAQKKIDVLHIGSSGSLSSDKDAQEKASLESLRDFIKEETGLNNDILKQKDWRELADKMAKGTLHVGVFQG